MHKKLTNQCHHHTAQDCWKLVRLFHSIRNWYDQSNAFEGEDSSANEESEVRRIEPQTYVSWPVGNQHTNFVPPDI